MPSPSLPVHHPNYHTHTHTHTLFSPTHTHTHVTLSFNHTSHATFFPYPSTSLILPPHRDTSIMIYAVLHNLLIDHWLFLGTHCRSLISQLQRQAADITLLPEEISRRSARGDSSPGKPLSQSALRPLDVLLGFAVLPRIHAWYSWLLKYMVHRRLLKTFEVLHSYIMYSVHGEPWMLLQRVPARVKYGVPERGEHGTRNCRKG
jgi:hypothetical protein